MGMTQTRAGGWAADCRDCPVRTRHFEGPVDSEALARLSSVMVRRRYRDGQTLYVEGHAAEQVFFVRAGAVRLTQHRPDGQEVLVDLVPPGDALGTEALFGAEQATTATACGTLACCSAPAERLRALLLGQPSVAVATLRVVQASLDRLRMRLADLTTGPADQRVARFLVRTLPEWRRLLPRFTQADIARSLALSPETLCRILAGFRQRRWVRGSGTALAVDQPAKLVALAEDRTTRASESLENRSI